MKLRILSIVPLAGISAAGARIRSTAGARTAGARTAGARIPSRTPSSFAAIIACLVAASGVQSAPSFARFVRRVGDGFTRSSRRGLAATLLAYALSTPGLLAQPVLYVDDTATGANDGSGWCDAYVYLQDALATVQGRNSDADPNNDVTEIRVAQGTYKPDRNKANPDGTRDRTATFQLLNGVALRGGYAGCGAPDPHDRNIAKHETILSGDLNGNDDPNPELLPWYDPTREDNSYHVVTGSVADPTTVLDGFTITAGFADGPYGDDHAKGAGMFNSGGSPTLTRCSFDGNAATVGGGMYNSESSPTLIHSVFRGNKVGGPYDGVGAGMYNDRGGPRLTGCIFSGNSSNFLGGGVHNEDNSATFTNCTFSRNSAWSGLAISNNASDLTVTNCILWDGGDEIWSGEESTITITYSNIQYGWPGVGNISCNPRFQDPVGTDGIAGTEDDDLRLSAGSCSIDAGDNSEVTTECDFGGNARLVDDPDTQDTGNGLPPVIDMGAFEYQPTIAGVVYVGQHATGPVHDGSTWCSAFTTLQDALAHAADPGASVSEIRVAQGIYRPDDGQGQTPRDREATFRFVNGVTVKGGYAGCTLRCISERDPTRFETVLSGDLAGNDGNDSACCSASATGGCNDSACESLVCAWAASCCESSWTWECAAEARRRCPGVCDNNAENSYHVVTHDAWDVAVVLDGFTITGGNADGDSFHGQHGGGVYYSEGGLAIRNCRFTANSASQGAGMFLVGRYGARTIDGCTFDGNYASIQGGGIYAENTQPVLTDCTFTNNMADDGGGLATRGSGLMLIGCTFDGNTGYRGGGMWSAGGPTLVDCTFMDNSAGDGGGVYNEFGDPTFFNCTFTDNRAHSVRDGGWHRGGGMYNWESDVLLVECEFARNIARGNGFGGGIYNDEATRSTLIACVFDGNSALSGGGISDHSHPITLIACSFTRNVAGGEHEGFGGGMELYAEYASLTDCVFMGNTAGAAGGGVFMAGSALLTNCVFHNNAADQGGALSSSGRSVITNCTFADNLAEVEAGAVLSPGSIALANCILWGNRDYWGHVDQRSQLLASDPIINFSSIQGWDGTLGGIGNHGRDPLFVPGPGGWYYLSQTATGQVPSSPCVDTGSDTAVNLGLDTLTTRSDEVADTGIVDMGYHYPITGRTLVMGDYDRSGRVDLRDIAGFQNCFTDEGPADVPPCCRIFDFEPPDADVDLDDFGAFELAITGP